MPKTIKCPLDIQATPCSNTATGVMAPGQVRVRDLGEVFQYVCAIDAALGRTACLEASAAGALKLVKTCGDHGFGPLTLRELGLRRRGSCCDTSNQQLDVREKAVCLSVTALDRVIREFLPSHSTSFTELNAHSTQPAWQNPPTLESEL